MNSWLIDQLLTAFIRNYHSTPILIFSPGRINVIGEHTDYNGGFVFPGAIDRGVFLAISQSASKLCSVYAYDKDEMYEFDLDTIQPLKNGGWRNYILGVISELQSRGCILSPFSIAFAGDIPIGAGLSSSAALSNSIVFALNTLFLLGLNKEEMVRISQIAEQTYTGVLCGIMDQYASMFGIKDHLLFLDCQNVVATPVLVDLEDYEFVLLNTNVKHTLSDTAYNDRRLICEKVSNILGVSFLRDVSPITLLSVRDRISEDEYSKVLYVLNEIERTKNALKVLKQGDLVSLGRLLYASHSGLQHLYKVSCDELDFLVEVAQQEPQVLGARMMGGGFGGCTLNLIKKSKTEAFVTKAEHQFLQRFGTSISVYKVVLSEGTHQISYSSL